MKKLIQLNLKKTNKVVLLGITTDKLTFTEQISNLCRTANFKVLALRRIRKYLSLKQSKKLCNAFINSQCSHVPIILMVCRKRQCKMFQRIY